MSKRRHITALIDLSRYNDYLLFVPVLSLFGLLASGTAITMSSMFVFLYALIGNYLAVCFSFMINDIEDAPDDALNPEKVQRNPISAGRLTRKRALIATYVVGLLSLLFYAQLGTAPFILGFITLLFGWFYSWKKVRLKNIPLIDIFSHCLMLGGLLFLIAYFAVEPYQGIQMSWLLPFLFISSFSAYGELSNELRDYTYDIKAGLKHSAAFLGIKKAKMLMYFFVLIGSITFVLSILIGIIPLWFIIANILLVALFSLPYYFHESFTPTQKARFHLEVAILQSSIITLFLWVIIQAIAQ